MQRRSGVLTATVQPGLTRTAARRAEVDRPPVDRSPTGERRRSQPLALFGDHALSHWYQRHVPLFSRRHRKRLAVCGSGFEGGGLVAATPTPQKTAVPGGAKSSRSLPSRVVPPLELPAPVEELARGAAPPLGGGGGGLPGGTLRGRP